MKYIKRLLVVYGLMTIVAGCDMPSRICFENLTSKKLCIIPSTEDVTRNNLDDTIFPINIIQPGQRSDWLAFANNYLIFDESDSEFIISLDVNKIWNNYRSLMKLSKQNSCLDFEFLVSVYPDKIRVSRFGRIRLLSNEREFTECSLFLQTNK